MKITRILLQEDRYQHKRTDKCARGQISAQDNRYVIVGTIGILHNYPNIMYQYLLFTSYEQIYACFVISCINFAVKEYNHDNLDHNHDGLDHNHDDLDHNHMILSITID